MFLFLAVAVVTTATTVVHSAYPQQPAVPPSYAAAPYQGYQPMAVQPQPGMPVAPYPAQYPPPYPTQPAGPPAYHETVAGKAAPGASSAPEQLRDSCSGANLMLFTFIIVCMAVLIQV